MSFIEAARKLRKDAEQPKLRALPDPAPVAEEAGAFDAPAAPRTSGGSASTYAKTALDREAESVQYAAEGTRNHALNKAAFNLGQLVSGGELTESEVTAALTYAAQQAGLDDREIAQTIRSGLSKGMLNPRTAPRQQILAGVFETTEQAAQRWEEPEPLEGEAPGPGPFPIEALPDRVRRQVEAVAANTQTPEAMAAMMALAALSAATVGRAWVHGGSGWIEPAVLWTVTALPPASRKSAVTGAMTHPLYAIERELQEAHAKEHGGKAERLAIAQEARKILITKASKAESRTERDNVAAELDALAAEIDELTVPEPPILLVDDFTPESLGQILQRNGGSGAALSAEGGVFAAISGRYTKGAPQLDLILKSYDGDPSRTHRIGREPVIIDRPGMALGLVVQPHVLAETTKTPALRERGLMGRFCYAVPVDTVGTREVDAPEIPQWVSNDWAYVLRNIAGLPPCTNDQPRRVVQLHPDALELHRGFRRALEPRLHGESGDLAFMADWAGKHAGRVLRIALLLHLAAGYGVGEAVDFDTMCAAVEIGEWMIPQAASVYGGWRAPQQSHGPARVLAWTQRTKPERFTVREAWQAMRGQAWCATADDMKSALVTLVEAGWLATVERTGESGRRVKAAWFVPHPSLLEVSP